MRFKKHMHISLDEFINEQALNKLTIDNLIKSDNFKRWFGDWEKNQKHASKVVDKNGKPLVVNHGSRNKFTVFEFDKIKNNGSNDIASVGFWFSSSKDFGKNFANNIWYGGENDAIIYHVFLSIKKPKIYVSDVIDNNEIQKLKIKIDKIENSIEEISSNWNMSSLHRKQGYQTWKYENETFELASNGKINDDNKELYTNRTENSKDAIHDGLTVLGLKGELEKTRNEFYDLNFSDSFEKFRTDIYRIVGKNAYDANIGGMGLALNNKKEAIEKYVASLKADGYDGIIIKNTTFDKKYAGGINDQYIVFNSNQIKSVENDGSFDDNDYNIYS